MSKYITLSLLSCLVAMTVSAQAPHEKLFVKSFNLHGIDEVFIEIDANYQIKQWDQALMRIEMKVNIDSPNPNMLRTLARTGRYFLRHQPSESGQLHITAPKLAREISQTTANEKIELTVWAPSDIVVKAASQNEL